MTVATQETTAAAPVEGRVWTAWDRCCRCGVQAYWRFTREDIKGEILMCNHHKNRHESALGEGGWKFEQNPNEIESNKSLFNGSMGT